MKGKSYRLRTLAYAYRISNGPLRTDDWLVRWEYDSADHKPGLHPRHHCHLHAEIEFLDQVLSLDKLHISSGWVTIEEVIRFLIHELKVPPLSENWDELLHESEERFREWTSRDV